MHTNTSLLETRTVGPAALSRRPLADPVLPLAGAVMAAVLVFVSSGSGRLPTAAWAAAFLFFAVKSDLAELRIPNALTFGALAAALLAAPLPFCIDAPTFSQALAGAGVAFALLFPCFALGGLGAGDVKAAMVLGALFGVAALLGVLWWALVAAGASAVLAVIARGEALDLLWRWSVTLGGLARGVWAPIHARPGTAAASGLPFAPALAFGCAAFALWGLPW